jgi:hypothetical protein
VPAKHFVDTEARYLLGCMIEVQYRTPLVDDHKAVGHRIKDAPDKLNISEELFHWRIY